MSEDFAAALRGFADHERAAAALSAPDPATEVGGLVRRVRRRRAVRTGSTALSAAAVVAAVAVAVQLSGARVPPPALPVPSVTDAPTATPTPTPSPTTIAGPSPSATSMSTPEPATFRGAQPMAPGMLASAGADWHLVQYGTRAQDESVIDPAAIYLISPDGRPFVVPTPTDPAGWYLLDWLPGSSMVLAENVDDGATRVLDLLSGESRPTLGRWGTIGFAHDGSTDVLVDPGQPLDGGTSRAVLRRLTADGAIRAETAPFEEQWSSAGWLVNPSSTRVVLNDVAGPTAVALDGLSPVALPSPYPARPAACRAWSWVDDDDVLMQCAHGGTDAFGLGVGSELWLVPVTSGSPRLLVGMPDAVSLGGVWRVGDRLIAGTFGPAEAQARWWEVDAEGVRPLAAGGDPNLFVYGVHGSEVLATLRPFSIDGPATSSLVAIDPVAGTIRSLVTGSPGWFTSLGVTPALTGPPQTQGGD
ncbi:hypothetical protein ACPPVS_17785 [Cellulomonas sp. McL0617]|uniref:hypothetical protein n=1 Tax=Cellulomonas sp. McL0617 TaxID=3415675 RepID=UPI003CEE8C26